MRRAPLSWVNRRDDSRTLTIKNQCPEVIYPGIGTQAGTGPATSGFKLGNDESRDLTVSADWQGRVWGRTNCSFNAAGTGPASSGTGVACGSGDCGGVINCRGTGVVPVTLAEFTMASSDGQTFYDISLVDGYNIPVGIIALGTNVPPNMANPICVGTASLLAEASSALGSDFGTNSSFPIPLEKSVSWDDVQGWCPWDLQLDPPTKPGDGVYPYPDDNIKRPYFNPCFSACAKYGKASDCCTGSYNSPTVCKASLYSSHAKRVCPDAYSFGLLLSKQQVRGANGYAAFDDQTSTFIIPSGGGFEVVFCPPGRSSNILTTLASQRLELARNGLTQKVLMEAQNATLINSKNLGAKCLHSDWGLVLFGLLLAVIML
ncbi:MAG: hypothetical protein Q9167_000390 [Letrouitia subvulpina]